jgi:organic hydroperoxide reductase OsmC/OhrA
MNPPPLGSLRGPNAARLLSASVANCLSASLLFCLRRSKVEVKGMRAEAEPIIERNKEGYWRVSKIIVSLRAELAETVQAEKARRCIEIFENYCVVTGSVRGGITVDVRVEAPSGTER